MASKPTAFHFLTASNFYIQCRTFGNVWWKILERPPTYELQSGILIIDACQIIHQLILDLGSE